MHLLHDISPDILVEAGAAVVFPGPCILQGLILVAASPDPSDIIGRIAHKPDIPVVRRSPGLSGQTHAVKMRPRRGGIDRHRIRKGPVELHGGGHRIREEVGRRLLHDLLRLILCGIDQDLSALIHNLREKFRPVQLSAVCDRAEGLRQLQIGDPPCETAERDRGRIILLRQSADAQRLRILKAVLWLHRLHQAAESDDIQRIHDAVPYALIAEIAPRVPVLEDLRPDGILGIIIAAGQGRPVLVDRGRKGAQDLEGRARLP